MSTLNYFYSCCYLGIWVLCRELGCASSPCPVIPYGSCCCWDGWGPAGWSDPDQIKAALITVRWGEVQTLEWGCFHSRKIILVWSAVFKDALCVPQLCKCWALRALMLLLALSRTVASSAQPCAQLKHSCAQYCTHPKVWPSFGTRAVPWWDSLLETSLLREESRGF